MLKSYAWLTFCVLVWGSNFVFGKMLVQDFSPAALTMLRLLFIILFLGVLSLPRKRLARLSAHDFLVVVILGIIGVFINQWSFFEGLQTADPTTSALILATAPVLTGFLAAVFLKEKLTLRMIAGSCIAILGIFFVVAQGNMSSIRIDPGLYWIVITMVTFAIMVIVTRLLSNRVDPLTLTLYSNIVGWAVSVPFVFILDRPLKVSTEWSHWMLLIVTAVVVHGAANLIWNQQIRYVDASKASILSNLEPFVAMVMGLILLGNPITGYQVLGSLFIIGGVLLSTYQWRVRLKSKK